MNKKINDRYNSNPYLPKAGSSFPYTQEMRDELRLCRDDPVHFVVNHFKIVHVDKGVIPFIPYEYQLECIDKFQKNRNVFFLQSRQSGKTSTATAVILHYALFNGNKTIGILANKAATSREILRRIKMAFEYLPDYLKGGVKEWNKSRVEFDNGTIIMAEATSSDAIRGQSLSLLYIDEHAFVKDWEEFASSVLPTLSSGTETKMIFSTTPNGMNHSYYYVEGSKKGTNDFALIEVPWTRVPGRDEAWKAKAMSDLNNNQLKFDQEYNLEFAGSSGTLISGAALKNMIPEEPEFRNSNILMVYENPIKEKHYIMTVDVSRGKGLDYSTFSVVDISSKPMKQVAVYRNNMILPPDFAEIVTRFASYYNECQVLVEVNDLGAQVADICFENDVNLIFTETKGRSGKQISFSGKADRGIRTSHNTKMEGCHMLKMLIEQAKLEVVDKETISELNVFSAKGKSYEAESGKHDDMVMTLVFFAWLSSVGHIDSIIDGNIMSDLREYTDEAWDAEIMPLGIVNDGYEEAYETYIPPTDFGSNNW